MPERTSRCVREEACVCVGERVNKRRSIERERESRRARLQGPPSPREQGSRMLRTYPVRLVVAGAAVVVPQIERHDVNPRSSAAAPVRLRKQEEEERCCTAVEDGRGRAASCLTQGVRCSAPQRLADRRDSRSRLTRPSLDLLTSVLLTQRRVPCQKAMLE